MRCACYKSVLVWGSFTFGIDCCPVLVNLKKKQRNQKSKIQNQIEPFDRLASREMSLLSRTDAAMDATMRFCFALSSRIYHPCSLCQSVYKKESRAIRGVCSGIDEIVWYFYYGEKKICNFKRKGMDEKMFVCAVDIRNACPDIHLFLFGKKRSSNEHAWLHAKSTCRANGDRGLGDSIARVSICTLSPIRIWPCSLYWKNI